ncbi:hypothetical protein [Streptomyces sp. AM8-1-1]|uniref:hypothetical protein n=1 Tax=Streptomyces sp. AM8-1-1 TaxID=3075825 RepID=UPI0028C4DB95|nr:hypothetical protein [Streptomyces sp. AM8-1-1]WNO71196.1 hypothetical protein RPQ07_05965 [Streptomyces sp. AM8-1-1]
MAATALTPYARLPRSHARLHVLHSTVDAGGRAHWLLAGRPEAPDSAPDNPADGASDGLSDGVPYAVPDGVPYDALVVTVDGGSAHATELSAVTARNPRLDALPDGGFVVADTARIQIFDALGRASWTLDPGGDVDHVLTDASGALWITQGPAVRRLSLTGGVLGEVVAQPGPVGTADYLSLNVGAHTAWAGTRTGLLEIRDGQPVTVRTGPVKGTHGLAVHGDRLALLGGHGYDHSRLVMCLLTETAAEPVAYGTLVLPDGGELGRRRLVNRGPRLYVQSEPYSEWCVLDLGH